MAMLLPDRAIVAVSGEDRIAFLQGLITNDVDSLRDGEVAYSCLLTAQGRFLHDFFVIAAGDRLLFDCEAGRRDDLIRRLKQFRLRAKVDVTDEMAAYSVHCHSREGGNPGLDTGYAYADPRHVDLGYRSIVPAGLILDSRFRGNDGEWEGYERIRITLGVPDGSRDMVPEQALLLENNIDRLNGISFTKGCYVGQEVTARMHHRGGVKKRLTPVRMEAAAPPVGMPVTIDGTEIGEMRSSCGDLGLALLRARAEEGQIHCGDAKLYVLNHTST